MHRHLLNYLLLTIWLATAMAAHGQVVTIEPPIVQQSTQDIVITFHADRGNRGLAGLGAADAVYAHTGVITDASASGSDWQYAPSWGDNAAKYRMTWMATDTWTLTIPAIDQYYGITDPAVVVRKLAFVFRNASGSRTGKTADGGDIFVDVLPPGLQVAIQSSLGTDVLAAPGTDITLTAYSTSPCTLSLTANGQPVTSRTDATSLSAEYRLPQSGQYEFQATAATADGTKATASLSVVCADSSPMVEYPGGGIPPMGAKRSETNPTEVTFCIAAPGKSSVLWVSSIDDYRPLASRLMNRYDAPDGNRYFWLTVPEIPEDGDTFYYYLVDGTRRVGDPYARLVLDPWNDQYIPSEVFPNLPRYPSDKVSGVPLAWHNPSLTDDFQWSAASEGFRGVDPSQLIIYELLVRDFTGTDGQALASGTVQGVIDHLDYIAGLGVNSVELLPVMEFNGNNSWGYNPNFYFAPDKAYGTPATYRRLVDEAHARGLAVIVDVVFNQTDGLHPWYQMYDIAQNPFYNGTAPHAYSVLNDWNQDNPLVQRQFREALQYWLREYRVDGFRFDLVKGLGTNQSYDATYHADTNTWTGVTDAKTNAYNASRVARMAELHAAMKEVNPYAYCINEDLAGAKEENQIAQDGEVNWANVNTQACNFAAGTTADNALGRFYAPDDGSRLWGSTVSYAESHDENRMAYVQAQSGVSGVRGNTAMSMRRLGSVAAMMLMTPGSHMIWQFQELGDAQATKNSSGNDTSPKRVPWNLLDDPDHRDLHDTYAALGQLRKGNPDLFRQDVTASISLSGTLTTGRNIGLQSDAKRLVLLVNPSVTRQLTVMAPQGTDLDQMDLLAASPGIGTPGRSSTAAVLPPGAFAIYGTHDVAAVEDIPAPAEEAVRRVYIDPSGDVVIEGTIYDHASVYDLIGRRVPMHGLAPGAYVVTVDDQTFKVTCTAR